jgi:hypothetical protein
LVAVFACFDLFISAAQGKPFYLGGQRLYPVVVQSGRHARPVPSFGPSPKS